ACAAVDPPCPQQRAVWPVLHVCSTVQGRLERRVRALQERTTTVARQAARVAAGQRPRGRHPCSAGAAHQAALTGARQVAESLRYLSGARHRLLEVVVLGRDGVLDSTARQAELAALLALP